MKHLLLIVVIMFYMVMPVGAECSFVPNTVDRVNKLVAIVKIIDPEVNNTSRPKMPKQDKYVELYTNKIKLLRQFDSSVLTLLSANGQQLYQVAIPEGADEVDIPVLSDVPVEVHINDGVNDYYGYIE